MDYYRGKRFKVYGPDIYLHYRRGVWFRVYGPGTYCRLQKE